MFKEAPCFWHQKTLPFWVRIFYPFLWIVQFLYDLVTILRIKRVAPYKLKTSVICIGNINLGGTGKTPTCLALYDVLKDIFHGSECHFLTRGYKGFLKGPVQVDPLLHKSEDVGDEALLLAKKAKTWVSYSRKEGGVNAQNEGATHVIMDDGFQNPSLFKDLSLLVVDGTMGFGNQKVFPLGPLREKLKEALKRAHGIVLIGRDLYGAQDLIFSYAPNLPIIKAHFEPPQKAQKEFFKRRVFGFAGIGAPQKFYQTLQELGAEIIDFVSFPDHYTYPKSVLEKLQKEAQKAKAILVTTEKDYVRLPLFAREYIEFLPVSLVFDDKVKLVRILKEKIR